MGREPDGVRALGIACLVIIAALLVIGVVSHEVVRHALQAVPALAAGVLALLNVRWAKWASFAVYVFWLGIAILIWLFLLGIARIASGTYTPTEVAMTIVLAAAGTFGLVAGWRRSSGNGAAGAALIFALTLGAQVLIMAISFKAPWAHDADFCAAFHAPRLCALIGH